jgi:hypothetical protein
MEILALPLHVLIPAVFLLILLVTVVVWFFAPAVFFLFRLRGIERGVNSLSRSGDPEALIESLARLFSGDRALKHLWSEFHETLHYQRLERDGQLRTASIRSTVPAEVYFNERVVVDGRVRTEFFKHTPGIFTGIGIIGTFFGLIEGLRQFGVSEDPAVVRVGLERLMHAVGEAFVVSVTAIAAAMVVTFFEKLLLSKLYVCVEKIAHGIDGCFEAGAGEEYLFRLVAASEASASQTAILKDALVRDLGDILRDISSQQMSAMKQASDAQVDAARAGNQQLGADIAKSIEASLREPLDRIAGSVQSASGDQSAAAVRMLNDVMVSFSQRLNELFGGQISGINALNQQTAQAMQEAVSALQTMVGRLEDSGRATSENMAGKMADAIRAMEERQAGMNAQMQAFVEQIRDLVSQSQSETQQKLQATLGSVGEQMGAILKALAESQEQVFEASKSREENMADRAKTMVGQMSAGVESAAKEIAAASREMSQSVATLTNATQSTVEKMNAGAGRLDAAATNFASAGDRVGAIMAQVGVVGGKLAELSGGLTGSATALQEALRDYRAQREGLGALLTEMRSVVEVARREAGITADVLQRIEASAQKLGQAQRAADEYLDGVNKVLAESNEAFGDAVVATVSRINTEFNDKLANAVSLLSGTVRELETTLIDLVPNKTR